MFRADGQLSLSFESDWGRFSIDPEPERENVFKLTLTKAQQPTQELGYFCSISDAISAVVQQQTGYAEWDELSPMDLPNRVHNITSWKFQQIVGTFPKAACS